MNVQITLKYQVNAGKQYAVLLVLVKVLPLTLVLKEASQKHPLAFKQHLA